MAFFTHFQQHNRRTVPTAETPTTYDGNIVCGYNSNPFFGHPPGTASVEFLSSKLLTKRPWRERHFAIVKIRSEPIEDREDYSLVDLSPLESWERFSG